MIDKQSKIYILIFVMLVLFLGWYHCPHPVEGFEEVNFQKKNKIQLALIDRQTYLNTYVYSIFNADNAGKGKATFRGYESSTPNYVFQNKILESNGKIANSISDFFQVNKTKESDLCAILKSIDTSLINLISNLREDDIDRNQSDYYNIIKRTSITRLYNDVDRLCVLLSEVTGKDYDKLNKKYYSYYKNVYNMIMGYNRGFIEEACSNMEKSNEIILNLSTYLTN